jgi:alkanesulfonate monooxygenase SsuD/methylene tetrahydromethanopterin reductase-like flavin-dependent oxidoreductase (luciferase family)
MLAASPPLAPGSISLRMYPHDLDAEPLIAELCAQAKLAETCGYDGLMTSEHHGGFRAYLPNPVQIAGFLLDATESIWAGPCPLLLPLRHWTQVAEDLAWLAARHPGRVAAGFAAGGLDRDFELAELPFEENLQRFKAALPKVIAALRGVAESPLGDDLALVACREQPIPSVAAAMSRAAARRAGALGIGILCDSLQSVDRLARIAGAHREACPEGAAIQTPRILIRRAWVGTPPREKVEAQVEFYRAYAADAAQAHWGGEELIAGDSADEVAERLADTLRQSGCDALNLRLHIHGAPPTQVREQIERVGTEVLPPLRRELARR